MECQKECEIECEIECQNLRQIEYRRQCQVECRNICQIDCQTESRNICKIECQNIFKICPNIRRDMSWLVMMGITRDKVFHVFFIRCISMWYLVGSPGFLILPCRPRRRWVTDSYAAMRCSSSFDPRRMCKNCCFPWETGQRTMMQTTTQTTLRMMLGNNGEYISTHTW